MCMQKGEPTNDVPPFQNIADTYHVNIKEATKGGRQWKQMHKRRDTIRNTLSAQTSAIIGTEAAPYQNTGLVFLVTLL